MAKKVAKKTAAKCPADKCITKDPDVVFIRGEDWEGLYLNGKLAIEDHILNWRQVLSALKVNFAVREADDEWLNDRGRLPENLSEVESTKA